MSSVGSGKTTHTGNIISTKIFLLKCNIGHSALCDFCSLELESQSPLGMYSCTAFWTNLSVFLQKYNVFLQINLRNLLLGIAEGTNITKIQIKTS